MRALIKYLIFILLLTYFAGCGFVGNHRDIDPETRLLHRYALALEMFNAIIVEYNKAIAEADAATQELWQDEIDPLFFEAHAALRLWKMAIEEDTPYKGALCEDLQESLILILRKTAPIMDIESLSYEQIDCGFN